MSVPLPTLERATLPPMMVRYLEYKDKYPDALLLFQVGDFYEIFYQDAVTVARSLNLTLTSRDKNNPNPVPMCGVPIAVVDGYIDRLVMLGHSVAVVSQSGTAQGKGGVERVLERIVTPGMRLFSSTDTDSTESLIVAVAAESENSGVSVAYTDVRTGMISILEYVEFIELDKKLQMLQPREVILPRTVRGERVDRRLGWVRRVENSIGKASLHFRPDAAPGAGDERLIAIDGFASLSPLAKRGIKLLLEYIDETTVSCRIPFSRIMVEKESETVSLDAATRRNLELTSNTRDGSNTGTLWWYLNQTRSPSGARLLRQWILAPLSSGQKIKERQAAVRLLRRESQLREELQEILSTVPDLERIAARVELQIASPRDLASLRDVLVSLPMLRERLSAFEKEAGILSAINKRLSVPSELTEKLVVSLIDSPPHVLNEGGIIKAGFNSELDKIMELKTSGDTWMSQFEAREKETTGIPSLKVKQNNIIGYFIEVTATHLSKVPQHYIRKQSTANGERYTTEELKTREKEVVFAGEQQIQLERSLFEALRKEALPFVNPIRTCSKALAVLDVLSSLAAVAVTDDLTEPKISDERGIKISLGRHPIIAKYRAGSFIPNSVDLGGKSGSCFIITGPNMGGKSTYLRQTALIVIMAQIGSFVPADEAVIGVVDRIFARIGASDDIHEGDSTFMVEMREAAHIAANATERSLVLIDELGRGTATSDGIALARSILEHLVIATGAMTLFATHYYELTTMESESSGIRNLSVGSIEEEGQVIFTHEIKLGAAPRSYGIEVAKLSGLPSSIIDRASELLEQDVSSRGEIHKKQLDLFARQPRPQTKINAKPDPKAQLFESLYKALHEINLGEVTPNKAINILYELQERFKLQGQLVRVANDRE